MYDAARPRPYRPDRSDLRPRLNKPDRSDFEPRPEGPDRLQSASSCQPEAKLWGTARTGLPRIARALMYRTAVSNEPRL